MAKTRMRELSPAEIAKLNAKARVDPSFMASRKPANPLLTGLANAPLAKLTNPIIGPQATANKLVPIASQQIKQQNAAELAGLQSQKANQQHVIEAMAYDTAQQAAQDREVRNTPNLNTKTGLYDAAPAQLDQISVMGNAGFDPKTARVLSAQDLLGRSNANQQTGMVADEQQRRKDQAKFQSTAFGATQRFGGVTNVTPQGSVLQPRRMASNALGLSEAQDVARTNQIQQGWNTNMARPRTMQGAQRRQRELEQDKVNAGLAQAKQGWLNNKLVADVQAKLAPAQAAARGKVQSAIANQGIDPATSQPFPGTGQQIVPNLQQDPTTKLWYDPTTGKPAPENVQGRLDMNEDQNRIAKEAANLDPALEKEAKMPWSIDDVWLFNRNTGHFEVGNVDEPSKKNSPYRLLTPDERASMGTGGVPTAPAPGLASANPAAQQPVQQQQPAQQPAQPAQQPMTGVKTNMPVLGPAGVPSAAPAAGLAGAMPVKTPQPTPGDANMVRAELLNDKDPNVKKQRILVALRLGVITKEQATAMAEENGLQ